MKINFKDLQDQNKMEFLSGIDNCIKEIELKRSRIYALSKNSAMHDAGYYMILLRRLYRKIEEITEYNSRVANLK